MRKRRSYHIGHVPRRKRALILLLALFWVGGGVGGFFTWQSQRTGHVKSAHTIQQLTLPAELAIDETFYTLKLPGDWSEKERKTTPNEQNITWHAADRELTIYVDRITPDQTVNRLLPLAVTDNKITPGQLSEPCHTFAQSPPIAKWQNIDFICDMTNTTGNKIGTGSIGTINTTPITGPEKGKHQYFFTYTDLSAQPDFNIFQTALQSFQAK